MLMMLIDRRSIAPKQKATLTRSNSAPTKRTAVPNKGSGKRTLVDVLDEDLAAKRMKPNQASSSTNGTLFTYSQFFPFPSNSKNHVEQSIDDLMPRPSRTTYVPCDKENLPDHAVDNVTVLNESEEFLAEPPDPVAQEDGYLSPSPSYFRSATPDLSSPVRPYSPARCSHGGDDFGADIISSPTVVRATTQQNLLPKKETVNVLVRETPPPMADVTTADEIEGPDLRDVLGLEARGDTDEDRITTSSSSTSGPITPEESGMHDEIDVDESIEEDIVTDACARAKRTEIVANGWWNKWARSKELRPSAVRICDCYCI
jgi:exonuclease-1